MEKADGGILFLDEVHRLPKEGQELLFYLLDKGRLFNIKGAYERAVRGESTSLTYLNQNAAEYAAEMLFAQKLLQSINQVLDIPVPDEELIFIAMYLRAFSNRNYVDEANVGVIVIAHGKVASGMAAVANRILGVSRCIGLDMDLDDSILDMERRLTEEVQRQNQGKGCMILADMGSLSYLVIEVLRKALIPSMSMDEIIDTLTPHIPCGGSRQQELVPERKAAICTCITREGAAMAILKYMSGKINEEELTLFTAGAMGLVLNF